MASYGFKDRRVAEKLKAIAQRDMPASAQGVAKSQPIHGSSWIIKTPNTGIPAQSGGSPGSAECEPYLIDGTGTLVPFEPTSGNAVTITVYNVGDDDISGSIFLPATMAGIYAIAGVPSV
jgi:hypothetical protein